MLRTAKAVATHRFSGTSRIIYFVLRSFFIILDLLFGDLEQFLRLFLREVPRDFLKASTHFDDLFCITDYDSLSHARLSSLLLWVFMDLMIF